MMSFISRVMGVFAVLALASVFSVSTIEQASAKPRLISVCKKNSVKAGSRSRGSKYLARIEARANWRRKVGRRHGYKWAVWRLAKARSTRCKGRLSGKYRCTAKAVPCIRRFKRR